MSEGKPLKRRRHWLWVLPALVVIGAVPLVNWGCSTLRESIAWGVVRASNYQVQISPADDEKDDDLHALGVDRQLRIDVGPPAASLSVWIIDPTHAASAGAPAPRGTILLLHGIHGNKRHMLGMAKTLAGHGFRAVLVDLRGHGRSSGDWLTYGYQESADLVQVLDALSERGLLAGSVGVYGTSYGGATAIMLAGRDPRVQAVVTVAAFSDMREVVACNIRSQLPFGGLLSQSWIDGTLARCGELAGFDPAAASPVAAVTRTKARILLVHGKADAKIPFSEAEALYAACRDHGRLILLDGEDHDSIMQDRSGTLSREVPAWFTGLPPAPRAYP